MLVLSRKVGQRLLIDGEITITITQVRGSSVRLGIEAPPQCRVWREEVTPKDSAEHAKRVNPSGQNECKMAG